VHIQFVKLKLEEEEIVLQDHNEEEAARHEKHMGKKIYRLEFGKSYKTHMHKKDMQQ